MFQIQLATFVLLFGFVYTLMTIRKPYEITFTDIKVTNGDSKYLKNNTIKITKCNKTTSVINGSIILTKDISNLAFVTVDGREIISKTGYSKGSTFKIADLMCTFMKRDKFVYPSIKDHTNFPKECPVFKNKYYVDDFILDQSVFPNDIPGTDKWEFTGVVYETALMQKKLFTVIVRVRVKELPRPK